MRQYSGFRDVILYFDATLQWLILLTNSLTIRINDLFPFSCFTLFSSSQYFITVLTINTGRIYSLFLIRQCQISVVAFR